MPKALYDRFKLVDVEPVMLELQLADGLIREPYKKLEDVIVKVLMKAQKGCINTKIYLYLAQLTRKPIMIFTIARVNNFMLSIHQTRNFIHHFFVSLFSGTYKHENGS